jgi:hypothetical protein
VLAFSSSGCIYPHVADSPLGTRRRSARCRLTGCSSCSSQVLACLSFDPFVSGFLVHEVHRRSVLECWTIRVGADGPWAHCGWSVIEGVVLEVQELFSEGPPQTCGQSA